MRMRVEVFGAYRINFFFLAFCISSKHIENRLKKKLSLHIDPIDWQGQVPDSNESIKGINEKIHNSRQKFVDDNVRAVNEAGLSF